MDEWTPETQPAGSLTPPPRVPPVAVATAAPLPPRPNRAVPARRVRSSLRGFVNSMLDRIDKVADDIAGVVGLR